MIRARLAPLLVTALAIVACAAASTPARAAADDDDRWLPLLARVPDEPAYREFVVLNDYAAALRTIDDGKGDALARFIHMTLEAGTGPNDLLASATRDNALRDELGISVPKIERDLTAGNPPDSILVLDADVDRDKVERATARDDTWSDLLEQERHAGQDYLAWDGERVHIDRTSPVRQLGIGGRLAVDPPLAVWTRTDAAMHASLDASGEDTRSLADDRDVRRTVTALEDRDVYTMFLTDEPPSPGAATGGPEALLTPKLVALGAAPDDTLIITLVQLTPADAQTNAERLRGIVEDGTSEATKRPWTSLVSVDEITTRGTLLVATLQAENPRLWLNVPLQRDSLLATEEAASER